MSALYRRAESIIKLTAAASLAGKEGFAYKLNGSNEAVIVSAITDVPHGIIGAVSEDGLEISAIPFGGAHGTVGVKLAGTVSDLRLGLTVTADGEFIADDASGARVICAMPLETGVDDEIIEAILLSPRAVPANAAISVVALPIDLASITGAGDVLTAYTPGFAFEVLALDFAVTVPVTTAAKAATLNAEIGSTNVTGGAVALTSANCTPLGAVVAGSAITAANTGTSSDTLSIEAASVTAFAEGQGVLLIKLRNLDTFRALGGATA